MTKQVHQILAVDDEPDMLRAYEGILSKKYELHIATCGTEAIKIVQKENVDLVLLDVRMPKMDGIEILKRIKKISPQLEAIIVSALKDIVPAVEAMKLGATDYITKPFAVKELLVTIDKALERRALIKENLYLKEVLARASSYCDLIGQSNQMKKVFQIIETIAPTESRVLITGESGTGKELVAQAIHKKSSRSKCPFIAINCAAIPESLLESELFGYEKGAFTGAVTRKLGKFELADCGTIFLDEIGCMPPAMQAKLLRVIQEKTFDRVGGSAPISVDVRIITATNINFKKAVASNNFREDLYYRLNVIPIHLPPLRERKTDIPLFLSYFLDKYKKELNRSVEQFSPPAIELLKTYDWPGNVRELQNVVERLVSLVDSPIINKADVNQAVNLCQPDNFISTEQGLKVATLQFEQQCVKKALLKTNGNRTQAARLLGVARSTLISKLDNLALNQAA